MIKVKYGIELNGLVYGWIGKELYRLPIAKEKRSYVLKKMTACQVGNNQGYYIGRSKKSLDQLQAMTTIINRTVIQIKDISTPF